MTGGWPGGKPEGHPGPQSGRGDEVEKVKWGKEKGRLRFFNIILSAQRRLRSPVHIPAPA